MAQRVCEECGGIFDVWSWNTDLILEGLQDYQIDEMALRGAECRICWPCGKRMFQELEEGWLRGR